MLCAVDRITIGDYCEWLETQPRRCSTFIPRGLLENKAVRRDVLFHTAGWGWRLRANWRAVLAARGQAPVSVTVGGNTTAAPGQAGEVAHA